MNRRRKVAYDMYALMGISKSDIAARTQATLRNFNSFDAPVTLFITVQKICDRNGWAHVGMFVQTLLLAAQSMGLATCAQECWSSFSSLVVQHMHIPDNEVLWCGVALGFKDNAAPVNQLITERENAGAFAVFPAL